MAEDIKLHVCGVCSHVSADPARLFPLLVRVGLPCISSFPHAGSLSWRIIVYPYLDRVIHCTWVYPLDDFPPFFGYYFFNVMLTVLLGLHIYWAFLIMKMFYKLLFSKVRVFFLCIFATGQLHQPIYFVLFFPFFPSSFTAGWWWPERWRRGRHWLTHGTKAHIESHQRLWTPRPSKRSLTPADDKNWEKGKWTIELAFYIWNLSC